MRSEVPSQPAMSRVLTFLRTWGSVVLIFAFSAGVVACDSGGAGGEDTDDGGLNCSFPVEFLNEGANRGAITPVDQPPLVSASEAEEKLSAFSDTDRVLGLPPSFHEAYEGTALAIPLDVLFEHEVMNLDGWGRRSLAITFCPLTSSTLVFDREAIDGARFDVSGLLLNKGNEDHPGNLVMVDEKSGESLWPQMSLGAVCGPDRGTTLTTLPAVEMRWARWKQLYPNTDVAIQSDTASSAANSTINHGGGLRRATTLVQRDDVPLGRVLGIPSRARVGGGTGGLAVPFQELDKEGPVGVVEVTVSRENMVVFWKREPWAAMVFKTVASFSVQDGQIVDDRSRSVWSVDGRALEGPRAGDRLDPVDRAYISAGRAWFDFQPDTEQWTNSQ